MRNAVCFLFVTAIFGVTLASAAKLHDLKEVKILEEEEEIKRPYSFAWKASRHYNGVPDREHIEERDENGITRGVFRYVDPRQKIQEVVYVVDDAGFQVEASNLPQDTPVVSAAKQRHMDLFEKIRLEHERIGLEQHPTADEKKHE